MATGATPPSPADPVDARLKAVQSAGDRGEPLEALVAAADSAGLSRSERRRLHRDVLIGPIGTKVDIAAKRGPERRREMIDILRPFLATVDSRVKRALPVGRRLTYHLIETRDPAELAASDDLAKLAAAAAEPSRRVRRGLRWYAELPVEAEPGLLRLRRADLVPVTRIDDVSWTPEGRLRITGHAYLAGLSVRGPRFNRAAVRLYGPRWLPPVLLRTRRVQRPEVTHSAAEPGCNYDWAGFVAELRPFALRWRAGLRSVVRGTKRLLRRRPIVRDTTTWRAEIVIWSRAARATGLLRGPAIGATERPPGLEVTKDRWVRPVWTSDRALQIVLQPTRAELTQVRVEGDAEHDPDGATVEFTGFLPGRPITKGRARVGGHRVTADFTPVAGGTRFTFGLSVPALLKEREVRRLWIEPKGDPAASVLMKDAAEMRVRVGDREITVLRDRRDRAAVAAHRIRPIIESVSWSRDGTLSLAGSYPDPDPGERELVLRHHSGLTFTVPVRRDGAAFAVDFAPGAMPRFGRPTVLPSGIWSMSVSGRAKGKAVTAPVRFDHGVLDTLDESPVRVPGPGGGRTYRLVATRFDVPVLVGAEDVPDAEKGAAGAWVLTRVRYPAERAATRRDATVYICFDGRFYGGNPRAVYEERLRRGDDREHIWVVRDGAFVPPGSAELGLGAGIEPVVVREGGGDHIDAMARAAYIVTNGPLPQWFRARDDQTVVQTWNGTPLKRIGRDQPHLARRPHPPAWHRQAAEVRNWHLLVSQSPWATETLRRALGYEGEVLESGLPRNDLLALVAQGAPGGADPAKDAVVAAIRARLGVPEGRRVVLYAPTSRDNDRKNSSVRFDLPEMRRALGRDHVLLVRGHMLQAPPSAPGLAAPGSLAARALAAAPPIPRVPVKGRPTPGLLAQRAAKAKAGSTAAASGAAFALDVSTYPDMSELMLVADVLITDYSAVIFDFAVTGRPILLYAPDLDRYDDRRGLYLDLATQAPGPLLSEQAEVIDALRSIDTVAADYAERHALFTATYAPHDDGKATMRLVDHVFSPGQDAS